MVSVITAGTSCAKYLDIYELIKLLFPTPSSPNSRIFTCSLIADICRYQTATLSSYSTNK